MKFLLIVTIALLLSSCGGKSTATTTAPAEITDECRYKDQVCKEAVEFQAEYNQMPQEQRKEMVPVLNNYIEQCERTRKMCKDSQK